MTALRLTAVCLSALLAPAAFGVQPPPASPTIKTSGTAPKPVQKKKPMMELPVLAEPATADPIAAPAAPVDNESVNSYRESAAAAAAKGDWAAAEENLRVAVRMDPNNADVVLELAKAMMEQGKEEAALAVMMAYSGPDPRVTQALGEAYVSSGRLREAEQVFMDLSMRRPAESFHRYNLGLVESKMGKFDMAENAYLRAIELDPKFADARYNLALLYIRNREYPKALEQLEEVTRLREDPDDLVNYGVVLRELNRFPASQNALEQALALDRTSVLAMNNLGITHYVAGSAAEAQKIFNEVLSLSPGDPTARSYLAKISSGPAAPAERATDMDMPSPKPKSLPGAVEKKSRMPEPPALEPQISADVMRLRKENAELKARLEELETRMDEVKRGVYKQMSDDDKGQARRVDLALKKAQDRLEKKERELAVSAEMDAAPAASSGQTGVAMLDDRLNELQKTLAAARMELEEVRRQQGPVAFSPEPGSTEERLDAADRAVQQLQRQIRQLTIERDMLRVEINALRPNAAVPSRDFGRTNINLADLASLLFVPGMEERLAHNVLWYRQNIGPFKSAAELKRVPGMDESHYSQMIDFISVGTVSAQ